MFTITEKMKVDARNVDLYTYMLLKHPDEVIATKRYARLKTAPNIVFTAGYPGFFENSEVPGKAGRSRNAIDFMIDYRGYRFVDAVKELLSSGCVIQKPALSMTGSGGQALPFQPRESGAVI